MTYQPNTNKLSTVTDNGQLGYKQFGFNQLAGSGASLNSYDQAGNLIYDHTKKATITYNYLNLPSAIIFANGNRIDHVYDANGTKLTATRSTNGTTVSKQQYLDGTEYQDLGGVYRLESVYHPEGRIYNTQVNTSNNITLRYEFSIKDHLGNTRMTFSDLNNNGQVDVPTEILQENHYYPFGMTMDGPWLNDATTKDNPYQYNGKELESFGGLSWNDYGARWYDGSVGRFTSVDPLADEAPDWTPYRYGFNNPILYIDPDGMFENRHDALQYAKDNGIKTGWFRSNKIVENKDGTFSIDNKNDHSSTSNLGGDLGVQTGGLVGSNDVMTKKYDQGNIFEQSIITEALRDGSTRDATPQMLTTPDIGPGKAFKTFQSIPKIPAGKTFFDFVKQSVRKGGQWMRKKKHGYLELDPKDAKILTTTSRGKPFSPKIEPIVKSKWAKVMELFSNFDDPRF